MSGAPAELGDLVARHAPKPPAGLVLARLGDLASHTSGLPRLPRGHRPRWPRPSRWR